jgi:hypothetical protein
MESFEIRLSPAQSYLLSIPNADVNVFLNDLFAPASANYNQLALEVQREFRQGGSPDVIRMTFDRVKYNAATGKGNFRIVLDVRFTFGCEDSVTEKKDQTSEWTFTVSQTHKTVTFYSSPFAEGRSTADEF